MEYGFGQYKERARIIKLRLRDSVQLTVWNGPVDLRKLMQYSRNAISSIATGTSVATGNSCLTAQAMETPNDDPSHHLLSHSITYRVAMGPQQGRKVFTLQTLPDCGDDPFPWRICPE